MKIQEIKDKKSKPTSKKSTKDKAETKEKKKDESSDSEQDSYSSEEEDAMDEHEYRKFLQKIFPSKDLSNKIKAGEKMKKTIKNKIVKNSKS